MASKNKVTLTFAGDSDQLEKAFGRVESAADEMAKDVTRSSEKMSRSSAESFDRVGDSAGDLDTRAMGFRDTITGVEDTMGGWSKLMAGDISGGLFTLGAGVGDLASGVENLVVPLVKAASQHAKTAAMWVVNHARMLASTVATSAKIAVTWAINSAKAAASVVASVARQIVAWALLGVQSLIHAAKVALAWLIAIGPIAIVIAAVVGLVFLIIKNWDTITQVISAGWELVKRVTSAAWETIKSWTSAAWEFIKRVTSTAWEAIKSTVTSAVGGLVENIRAKIELAKAVIGAAWTLIKGVSLTAWTSIKTTITNIMSTAITNLRGNLDRAVGFFRGLPARIGSALSTVASAITAPFKKGFDAIRGIWNNSIGGKGFSVPSWVPGVGGKEFRIPKLHTGGIFNAPNGRREGFAMLRDGEQVLTPSQSAARNRAMATNSGSGQGVHLTIDSGGSRLDDLLVEILRKAIRNRGGGVVQVLG